MPLVIISPASDDTYHIKSTDGGFIFGIVTELIIPKAIIDELLKKEESSYNAYQIYMEKYLANKDV